MKSFDTRLKNRISAKGVSILSVHPGPVATDMGAATGFDNAASTSVISESPASSLKAGHFHLFPDDMAKQFESAYQSFSDNIVLADFLWIRLTIIK